MREKIERYAKGEFEFKPPALCLSENRIEITIEAGKIFEGSFTVENSIGRDMKGLIYSSHRLLVPEKTMFHGTVNQIDYKLDATYLKAGEELIGDLTIISDCGEQSLPFHALIEEPYCITSLGKVKDLFQFANLARMDWTEAKKVFRSEDFKRVILRNEEKYIHIYQSLLKNISTSQALEEFLIAIHKKPRIELSIDKTSLSYKVLNEEFMDKLILTKNHWGYAEIRVSTDAPFIRLEQKFVWADRFIGNTQQIYFLIMPQHMRPGNNFGRIFIKTVFQTITVDLVCQYKPNTEGASSRNPLLKRLSYHLANNYLELRLDRINPARYTDITAEILKKSLSADSTIFKLMQIHLSLVTGRYKVAGQLLNEFSKEEASLKKSSVLEHCAYLYLEALYHKEEASIRRATETMHRYYTSGHPDWRILWFLLYTDKRYDKNKSLKLNDIRDQFDAGCRSPILYYEAMMIYEEEPYQLKELTDFEQQVLYFGIRNNLVSKDTALQYTYLANRCKHYNPLIFRCLTRLYEKYEFNEILAAICSLLIKGMKKSNKYFKWFRSGVEAQLRITELYEYYLYTAEETYDAPLALPVLQYFIYNSSLNDKKRALLYANIIRNKDVNSSIYRSYYKRMELFAQKQLEAHNISPNLAILYREFMEEFSARVETAKHLPYVIFTHVISCDNPNMVMATVIHRELKEEESVPLSEGRAYIQVYTSETDIFLQDAFGNRYCVSVNYILKPLLQMRDEEYLMLEQTKHPMLLLHVCERFFSYRIMNELSINIRKLVLQLPGLQEDYGTICLTDLVDYYYDHYNEELLEHYLMQLKPDKVKVEDRIRFLEYLAIRGHFDRASDILKDYGFEGVSVKKLVRICSAWLKYKGTDSEHSFLTSLCYYIYSKGKYDENMLTYLLKHYQGPTEFMLKLWASGKGFELETYQLEERLIGQMLFTGNRSQDSLPVFMDYQRYGSNRLLIKAFLSYHAYQYLIHDGAVGAELLKIMRGELNYEENDICLLAWMRFYAEHGELPPTEHDFVSYHISRLVKRGMLLPFFKAYSNRMMLTSHIRDKFYIEYKSDPKHSVYIHYRLLKKNGGTDYITEKLSDTFYGIHVKEIVLYYREVLEYYFTEEYEGEVTQTDVQQVENDSEDFDGGASKYTLLNRMLRAFEKQEEVELSTMMKKYMKSEFMLEHGFKPIM